MGVDVKMSMIIAIVALFHILQISSAATNSPNNLSGISSLESFNQPLFNELTQSSGFKSLIYSPFSIHTGLGMLRIGADGPTAVEMDQSLGFNHHQTPNTIADYYHSMLSKYKNTSILMAANKIYIKDNYELRDNYKDLVSKKFLSSIENINFSQREKAAQIINTWVENATNHMITDLIDSDLIDNDTRLLLLSVIHFKGKWANAFEKKYTGQQDFYTEANNTVKVQMMFRNGDFEYGVDHDLDANILRLPYEDSDLAMLIIMPRSRNGFSDLKKKLQNFQFQSWKTKKVYSSYECDVYLPKFKTEFQILLNQPLQKMGMKLIFGNADLGKMLKSSEPLNVSNIVHKAIIEVNEEGTECSAATDIGISLRMEPLTIKVNHPFVYAIVNEDFVPLFQGTFVGV